MAQKSQAQTFPDTNAEAARTEQTEIFISKSVIASVRSGDSRVDSKKENPRDHRGEKENGRTNRARIGEAGPEAEMKNCAQENYPQAEGKNPAAD